MMIQSCRKCQFDNFELFVLGRRTDYKLTLVSISFLHAGTWVAFNVRTLDTSEGACPKSSYDARLDCYKALFHQILVARK